MTEGDFRAGLFSSATFDSNSFATFSGSSPERIALNESASPFIDLVNEEGRNDVSLVPDSSTGSERAANLFDRFQTQNTIRTAEETMVIAATIAQRVDSGFSRILPKMFFL